MDQSSPPPFSLSSCQTCSGIPACTRIVYNIAPTVPPSFGASKYTQNPFLGPGIAIRPHPAMTATSLGPKSLAGLSPPCVSGPYNVSNTVTVRPTYAGIAPFGTNICLRSVNAKMTNTNKPVAHISTRNANAGDTADSGNNPPGAGKYSPNVDAVTRLSGVPREMSLVSSMFEYPGWKIIRLNAAPSTAPRYCAPQYGKRLRAGKSIGRKTARARDTAGLRCAPEIDAVTITARVTPRPKTAVTCQCGTFSCTRTALQTAPTLKTTMKRVPTNSARHLFSSGWDWRMSRRESFSR